MDQLYLKIAEQKLQSSNEINMYFIADWIAVASIIVS